MRVETLLGLVEAARAPLGAPAGNALAQARTEAEQMRLAESLRRNANNRSVTAAELGISRAALYKKLKKYGLCEFGAAPAGG